ncbi:MAG: methyltransferase regulatory domain-containing protein [Deltaproteobacteria bacterium]|nr:methyltransferase regulatory domain-containing protein [Deltaproteobacteria bacterium]
MGKPNPYDELLYTGYPFAQSHPDRLATLAMLFGMKPAPVESCGILELGCGDGANLIPMAFGLPGSRLVGIDSAARSIAKGKAMADALGLRNISLHQLNVLEISPEFGQFDYIIAHGLYSWVPPAVQDKILSVCKMNLAPQGVAYVSYNTYPGGHLRQMIREMMLFHVRGMTDPLERIGQARGLVKFLSESQPQSDEYALLLQKELDRTLAREDHAIYHDDLAEINRPVYFREFIEHAARHGLQYLTEAHLLESQTSVFPPQVAEVLKQEGVSIIAQEQYLDFIKCRRFRQTLLCHDRIGLDRSFNAEPVRHFYIASSARPVSTKPNVASSSAVEEFRASNGAVMSTSDPLAKAAMLFLGELWPQSCRLDQLLLKARVLLGPGASQHEERPEREIAALCEFFLKNYRVDVVELHAHQPSFKAVASECPAVSPLARLQARHDTIVTNLRHMTVELTDSLGRNLLLLLDGTRNRATLLRELVAMMESEKTGMRGEETFDLSFDRLEQKLSELARLALLVA